jgi:Ribonuclease G/E
VRRELLIAAGPGEWRAAWLEDGRAAELYVERGLSHPAGSIHLGRVVRLAASLDAALVDIGEERPGFLPLRPSMHLDEGARIVVQVRREAGGGKGAQLALPASDDIDATGSEPPTQLHPPPGFAATLALRLPAPPETVVTDDAAALAELRTAFPLADIRHTSTADFPADLDALFDEALSPSVAVPRDGTIHIDETRVAVFIDVDTGTPETGSAQQTRMAANLAAVRAISRQLRLRQFGGGIAIDFAGVEGKAPRERIRQAMETALAGDPAQPQVLGWTRLGHFEIVRPRRGRPLSEAMLDAGTARKNALALAFEALRRLYREARAQPAANWRLDAAPEVAAALHGQASSALQTLQTRLGRTISVETRAVAEAPPFDIVRL